MSFYVSSGWNLLVQVRAEKQVYNKATGELEDTIPRLFAQFQRGAPDWAKEIALGKLDFGAIAPEVDPTLRMGSFDVEAAAEVWGWSAADKKIVVEALDKMQGAHAGFVKIEIPKLEAPWPAIENLRPHGRRTVELSVEKLVETADTIGVGLSQLVPYLRQETWPDGVVDGIAEIVARRAAEAESAEELIEA